MTDEEGGALLPRFSAILRNLLSSSLVGDGRAMLGYFLTALTLGTAFIVGMIGRIGFGFLPLIDHGRLLLWLGFYCSVVAIALSVGINIVVSNLRQAGLVDAIFGVAIDRYLALKAIRYSIARGAPLVKWLLVLVSLARRAGSITLVISVVSLAAGGLFMLQPVKLNGAVLKLFNAYHNLPVYLAISAAFLVTAVVLRVRFQGVIQREISGFLVAWAKILLVGSSLILGAFWVDVQREYGAGVTLHLHDKRVVQAVLILPSADGMIILWDLDSETHYLPWMAIDQLDASNCDFPNSISWPVRPQGGSSSSPCATSIPISPTARP